MSPNVDEHVHVRVSDSISRSPGDQPVVGSRPFEHPAFDEVTEVYREGKGRIEVESEVTAFLHDAVDGLRQCYGAIGGDVPGECLDFGDEIQRLGDEVVDIIPTEHLVVGERQDVCGERLNEFRRVLVLRIQVVRRLKVLTVDVEQPSTERFPINNLT